MSFIKKDFIDQLLDKVILQDVIGDFVELKRSGSSLKGLTPFGKENTPSFMVSPVKQIWKDFHSGKGGSGAVSFLMAKENLTYPEAIEWLAKKYNETVQYENSEFAAKKAVEIEKKEKLRPVLKKVHELYVKEYHKLAENHPARIEVEDHRKYDEETIAVWEIGYAPENFLYDILYNSAKIKEGKDLGLISARENSKYDKYANRVIYPIHDPNGLIIGFAGRDLTNEKKNAKWINPIVDDSNILYQKEKVWYGMHRARSVIAKKGEAWITEGYNDVIAWHRFGIENTVSASGTAISPTQIAQIKRLCTRVVMLMDPDPAGIRAMVKLIPQFIKEGFRTEYAVIPCDPDDFVRLHYTDFEKEGLEKYMNEPGKRMDGFKLLLEHHITGGEVEMSIGAKVLCELIAQISDSSISEIYLGWLQKESKIKLTTLKKWVKEFSIAAIEVVVQDYNYEYQLPVSVKIPFSELESDIKNYGMFMANNQIFMSLPSGADNKIHFTSMSNFMIEVLQHMQDEKYPMKLIRIKNIHGLEKIFDTQSENLNSFQAFDNAVTGHGNFRFDGGRNELLRLRTYLFDKMGTGRKIDVLGWQPDGKFWAWNNQITSEDGAPIEMNKHGVFVVGNTHYYIPSANEIYLNNSFKFDSQKRFILQQNTVSFPAFALKVKSVHRDHAISAILFGIASIFQDFIVAKLGNFPLLFFYGPGSSGKDELAAIVQSFVGIPQVAINLEGNVSTIKAQVREFAQFRNGISQLSEYKRGNPQLDGMLKALWDRRGYKRGNIESHVGTDSIPIESSAILTGNDFPNEEPLILRLIWNEMNKAEFSTSEMKSFDELKDMRLKGVSGYSNDFFKYRIQFEKEFETRQRSWKGLLQELFPEAKSRIVNNLSILCTTYEFFRDVAGVNFPWSQEEMIDHFRKGIDQQIRKINSASILNRFWDCFVFSLRGPAGDRIQEGHIVNIEGNSIFFNMSHVYGKIQKEWWNRYKEMAPVRPTILEQLQKSGAHINSIAAHSYSKGRTGSRTSAEEINLLALDPQLRQDLIGSIMYQKNETEIQFPDPNIFSPSPATPNEEEIIREEPET